MATRLTVPFNLFLLKLTKEKLFGIRPVTVLDIFDGQSSNFHPDGLFSTEIFGKTGDARRNLRYSYIDVKIPLIHPAMYRALAEIKRLYAGIVSGNEYAIWDDKEKDFIRSNPIDGQTGFAFFMQHWSQISLRGKPEESVQPFAQDTEESEESDDVPDTDAEASFSAGREANIALLEKYVINQPDPFTISKIIVMPAGLRDVELEGGRVKIDEINTFYQNLISISNTVTEAALKNNPEILNKSRYRLQMTFNNLYAFIEGMIEGKHKLLMGKWAARRIQYGTRNVITTMNTRVRRLGQKGAVGFNSTAVGMYQHLKAITPITLFNLRNGFLSKVFSSPDMAVKLVNKKTLMQEDVYLKAIHFNRWMTDEGLEKVLTSFATDGIRHEYLQIEGRYLGLIYKGPDGSFRLLQSIDELRSDEDRKFVTPLTFAELLYVSTYRIANNYPGNPTRYPVTGVGSIYPSFPYMRTTVVSEQRHELDENWQPIPDAVAMEFPLRSSAFFNTLAVASSRLAGLGADFDGDTASWDVAISDEAIQEFHNFIGKRRAYVGTDGRFMASTDVSTVALVVHNLTTPLKR